jgi:transcriptional regulator with XRE-family HTH domain
MDDQSKPIDEAIGRKIRAWRKLKGWTQSDLGNQLGVTFQQIQKYELGINSLSVARLRQFADILGKPVNMFLEDDDSPAPSMSDQRILGLARNFSAIPSAAIRDQICALVRGIAKSYE